MICAVVLLFFPSSCLAKTEIDLSKKLSQFTRYAEDTRKDWHVPGMAIAIVKGNDIVYAKGFGIRNESGDLVTANTIFDIASLTKSFTATLLAMQIDNKKYSWTTKVVTLYPNFRLFDQKVTSEFEVQDLLSHNSGLPEGSASAMMDLGYDIKGIIYSLRFIRPVSSFRKIFAYQNIFPMLAGEIVQRHGGKSYSKVLHDSIFSPLRMYDSYNYNEEELYRLKNVAQPFLYNSEKLIGYPINSSYQINRRVPEKAAGGSGGIHSSVNDIAQWLIFNINNGAIGEGQLVSVKNMNYIHSSKNKIKIPQDQVDNINAYELYGQGWYINTEKYKPYTLLYHPGGGMGMHALMAFIPEKKVGIIILTNTWGNKVPEILYRRFFDLYLNNKLKDWNRIYLQEEDKNKSLNKVEKRKDECVIGNKSDLDNYIGLYYNPAYGNIRVSKHNDQLELYVGPISVSWNLEYCNDSIFHAFWPNPYGMEFLMLPKGLDIVRFEMGKSNNMQQMTIPFLDSEGNGTFVKKSKRD